MKTTAQQLQLTPPPHHSDAEDPEDAHSQPSEPEEDVPELSQESVIPSSQPSQPAQKKRQRPSKRDIIDYPFTDDQVLELVELIKAQPCLYNKKDRLWINPVHKEAVWKDIASHFPSCTFQQVKKYFEKKRTDFGKIEKRESKSGAPLRDRTTREEIVMTTWAFLSGHIAHEPTQPSATFSPAPGPSQRLPPSQLSGDDDSGQSDLSLHSLSRRRRTAGERQPSFSSSTPDRHQQQEQQHQQEQYHHHHQPPRTSPPAESTPPVFTAAIADLLTHANKLTTKTPLTEYEADIQRFLDFLFRRLKKVSPANFQIVTTKLLEIVNAMEEPSNQSSLIKDPRAVLAAVAGPSQAAPVPVPAEPQQQQQQQMVPPPPPPAIPMYPQYPQHQFYQQQTQYPPPPQYPQEQQQQQQQYYQQPPQQQQTQQQQPPTPMVAIPFSPSTWPMLSPFKTPMTRAMSEIGGPSTPVKSTPMKKSASIQTPRGPDEPDSEEEN